MGAVMGSEKGTTPLSALSLGNWSVGGIFKTEQSFN